MREFALFGTKPSTSSDYSLSLVAFDTASAEDQLSNGIPFYGGLEIEHPKSLAQSLVDVLYKECLAVSIEFCLK